MDLQLVSMPGITKPAYVKLRKMNPFFMLFIFWNIGMIFIFFNASKELAFISINHFRSFAGDIFFSVFSFLGNGTILIPLALLFIYRKKYKYLAGLVTSALLNTLLVSWLKHAFDHFRPLACYGENVVQTASWITLYQKYSFPSGHTAIAFCIALYMSLAYRKNPYIAMAAFLAACLTGYSRVYLGEHFLEDVWFGSAVGVCSAYISFIAIEYIFKITSWKRKYNTFETIKI